MISQLDQLRKDDGHEYVVMLDHKYFDIGELIKLVMVHDMTVIKYQIEQENEWFCKRSDQIHQPKGTPRLDSSIPSTLNSMLHDTSKDHYWSALQLKTCEIQCLAVNHWLSDLIIYRIAELLPESNSDIYVFYYNFNSDIKDGIKRIHVKNSNVKPEKIIFVINVGTWNGKTNLGNTMVGRKLVSGCHFPMGVYYTQ